MEENVVFDPNAQKQDQTGTPGEQAAVDENNAASIPQDQPVEQGVVEQTVSQEEAPPDVPPPPIGGGFLRSVFFKIIIGVVIVFLSIFFITLLLPKHKAVKNVKLVWWGLWEDSRIVQPIIDDFERQHPEIAVEYVKQDPQDYLNRLQTRIQNGSGPDIFTYHNTWYLMLSGILAPFSTDIITLDEFNKVFYPVMNFNLVHNNAVYGIPFGADTLALFVNTDLLKGAGVQVPRNWDDFAKAAAKMTVKADNGDIKTAGAALGTYSNITHAPDVISMLFIQQGVDMTKFLTEGTNEASALDFYTSFAQNDQAVWGSRLDESLLAFAKGNLAMYFGYSWDIFTIQKLNSGLPFKIYPVPGLYGKSSTVASYWVNGISNKGQNQVEAGTFMHYLAQKDTAAKIYGEEAKVRAFGEPYARRDLVPSLQSNPLIYPFESQLDNAYSTFFTSDTQDGDGGINTLSNTYLENAINSMLNENTSTQTVVDTLDQGIGQVFSKYASQ